MKTCSIGKKEMKTRNWEGRVLAKNILDIRRKLPKIKFELIFFQISITYWARYIKYLYILPFIKTGAQSSKIGKNYKNCTLLPFFLCMVVSRIFFFQVCSSLWPLTKEFRKPELSSIREMNFFIEPHFTLQKLSNR